MILTCPTCATRYFLRDVLIGRAGRTVKCTSCGETWRAEADDDDLLALDVTVPEPLADQTPPPLEETAFGRPAAKLSQSIRAQSQVQQKVREAAATGAIWAGMAAGLVLVLAVAAVFRMNVVRLWPKTASAYAAVGLPVNPTGLIIEQVKAAAAVNGGHPAVQVSGVMRNIIDQSVAAPVLRVSLLGKDGHPLIRRTSGPDGARIRPGETRHFAVNLLDPPQGASDVEVTFAPEAAAPRPVASPAPPVPKLRGPAVPAITAQPAAHASAVPVPAAVVTPRAAGPAAPREAKPLPPGSPYALPAVRPSVS